MFNTFSQFVEHGSTWAYLVVLLFSVFDVFIPLIPSETVVITAGVIAVDAQHRILLLNRSAETLLEQGEQIEGKSLGTASPELEEFMRGQQTEANVLITAEGVQRTLAVKLGDRATRGLYAFLVAVALVMLARVGIATSWWAALGLVGFVPLVRAITLVARRATGRALIPVLQLTGLGELLYAAGIFAGLLIGR